MGGGRADYFGARSGKVCAPWPASSLLEQRNPSCDIRTYQGGQWACHHMWALLDADQPIPWEDRPLTWRIKIRFWVQPYDQALPYPAPTPALTLSPSPSPHPQP